MMTTAAAIFSAADADAFALALLQARQPGAPRAVMPRCLPQTDADAYRVQDLVRGRLGPTEGWKVGASHPGATPNCSPVLKGGVITASRAVAPLSIPVPVQTGVEAEIAFRMARPFPAAATAPTADDVLAGIGSAHIAMELCVARLAEGASAPPLASLADNGTNLGFVIGPEIAAWRSIDTRRQRACVMIDGAVAVETVGGHTHHDLAALLVWLVGHVVTTRGGLEAGAIVATGSWTGLTRVDRAALVTVAFEGLGQLEARLAM